MCVAACVCFDTKFEDQNACLNLKIIIYFAFSNVRASREDHIDRAKRTVCVELCSYSNCVLFSLFKVIRAKCACERSHWISRELFARLQITSVITQKITFSKIIARKITQRLAFKLPN